VSGVIRILPGIGDRDAAAMLECAKTADLKPVLIVGVDAEGELFVSSSTSSMKEIAWLVARMQAWLHRNVED
jgi:hypothetical protein